MDTLPHASEAEVSLSPQELEVCGRITSHSHSAFFEPPTADDRLQVLRNQFIDEGEKPRPQTKFNYAWALVRSRSRHDQQEGIKLLHEIYKDLPSRRRECLYYLALGEYKLGNYKDARKYNETLLQVEQRNQQSLTLRRLIDDKVKSEGLVGMAIVGAAVAAIGVLAASLLKRPSHK
ncbi:hypothetical protein DFS34DRAFT_87882 [Phlyctochytrium arcticum]|nr:hypothetical protein DFS34DRAFT_87882 [Phlyctochytrium arcticum]